MDRGERLRALAKVRFDEPCGWAPTPHLPGDVPWSFWGVDGSLPDHKGAFRREWWYPPDLPPTGDSEYIYQPIHSGGSPIDEPQCEFENEDISVYARKILDLTGSNP